MKTLVLIGKRDNAAAQELAREIRARYAGHTVVADAGLARALGWEVSGSDEETVARADLVVVLGGDGTLIHAARLLGGRAIPVLGINLGSLGFMTEVPRTEVFPALDDVLAGNVQFESRMKLGCRLWRDGAALLEDEVLNDVVINKGALARIAEQELLIDGQYVTTYNSDGVIVATPTGSTAYSLSAGGPIVHPALDCVVVSPICSHALTQRSIVVPPERTVSVLLKGATADMYLTIDGQTGHALRSKDRVEIFRSKNRVLLVRNPRLGYFSILRQKLHWGER